VHQKEVHLEASLVFGPVSAMTAWKLRLDTALEAMMPAKVFLRENHRSFVLKNKYC
jgi:hypothetical protein